MDHDLSKKIVLVVDDSMDNQCLLKTIFSARDCRVYSALNGREALSLLRELTVMPNLILLDAQMPIMDGYQFRMMQKLDPRLKDIPVIVMTAEDDAAVYDDMLGPQEIIKKPIHFETFIDSVQSYI